MPSSLHARLAALLACAAALGIACANESAQEAFPSRPVRLVVPTPPGGTNDILARAVAQQLTRRLGQNVFVENRPGGNGQVGAEAVVRAPADGYTLFATWAGPLALYRNFTDNPSYDAARDLAPISLIADVATVLVAHPSLPAGNLREFIAHVKAHPGKVAVAITTIGSIPHLLTEQLRAAHQLDLVLVPYQGSGPAIRDLLGNQTQAHFENLPAVIPLIQAGRLKALVVAGRERIRSLPDVQTTAEAGYPGLAATPWFALAAPAAVPANIRSRLNAEITLALRSAEIAETFDKAGARPRWTTQEEAVAFIASERSHWSQVVRGADIRMK